jgi:hypothetical protein
VFAATDKRLRNRIYFYISTGQGVAPEMGVGGHAHTVNLNNLYDFDADPKTLRPGLSLNAQESAVLNAGYDGYVVDFGNNQRAAVLLGDHRVEVRYEGTAYRGEELPAGERATPNLHKRLLHELSKQWKSRTAAEWALFTKEKAPELYEEIGGRDAFKGEGYLWPDQIVEIGRAHV